MNYIDRIDRNELRELAKKLILCRLIKSVCRVELLEGVKVWCILENHNKHRYHPTIHSLASV